MNQNNVNDGQNGTIHTDSVSNVPLQNNNEVMPGEQQLVGFGTNQNVVPEVQSTEHIQTVEVNNNTLGSMIKFNIPAEQINTVQPEPVPVVPNENVQPTLGSFINNNTPVQNNTVNASLATATPIQNVDVSNNGTMSNMQMNNAVPSVQSMQMPAQNMVNQTSLPPSEDGNKKKNNLLLKILIFVLLAGIGVVVGIILFEKFGNKNNASEDNNGVENVETALNDNVINNTDVELATLTKVLNIVGIASTGLVSNNDMLNYYVSNDNYQEYAKEIISYYANVNNLFIVLPEDVCEGSHCYVIDKDEVLKIFKLYNFGGNITDYFVTTSSDTQDNLLKTDYSLENQYLFPDRKDLVIPNFANGDDFVVKHNMNVQYSEDTQIQVVDNQELTYYDEERNVITKNKEVTYEFRQDDTNEYYLYSVSVKEVE